MEISEEKVREILKTAQEPVSLETPIGKEEDSHLGDFIEDKESPAPPKIASHTLLKEQLDDVLQTLTYREKRVLELRFGIATGHPHTLEEVGKEFPQDPWEQLKMSIDAVFNSWNNNRAIAYRRINKLRNDAGTGVNIQTMVFGNLGETSGTGVSFTRNPGDGKKEHYGEFLLNAQGEDVVAGIRTPKHIDGLKDVMPGVYKELLKVYDRLEKHYKDLQDFEFTIQEGKLYLLQTRKGKRTTQAAIKIAVAKPKGTAIIIAPNVTRNVPIIMGAAPKKPAEGYQLVPKRKSVKGTSPKKESPLLNRNTIIKNTNIVAKDAKTNKSIFICLSLSFNSIGLNCSMKNFSSKDVSEAIIIISLLTN